MRPRTLLSIVASWVLLCLVFTTSAYSTGIQVNADNVQVPVNPLAFGNNVIYYGSSMGFPVGTSSQSEYDAAKAKWNSYLPLVRELGPTILRYPGGLLSNSFGWKSGIGPVSQRDPNYDKARGGGKQVFGTDEFLQYCEAINAQAMMTVNVSVPGSTRPGSVQDAADWVEYCNAPNDGSNPGGGTDWAAIRAANGHKMPYGVKYWELGNEVLFPGKEDYATRVQNYSTAMKAIDPTIKIGVIRTGGGIHPILNTADFKSYQQYMLATVGDYFDFWSHLTHPPSSSGDATNGFVVVKEGAGAEAPFDIEEDGSYYFVFPAEAECSFLNCPTLTLLIDGNVVQTFSLLPFAVNMQTVPLTLTVGRHLVRVEGHNIGGPRTATVCQQLELHTQGQTGLVLIDFKQDPSLYEMVVGASVIAEKEIEIGAPYTGGKPVYFTETSIEYKEDRTPPLVHKVCDLREALALASLYNVYLSKGIGMIGYWTLFDDNNANGVLEGVAWNSETGSIGRSDPHRRPSFHVLKAYRWNIFDELVDTSVSGSPTFTAGPQTSGIILGFFAEEKTIPYLQVLASKSTSGDKLSLFVLNLDPENSYNVPVQIQGFNSIPDVTVYTITGSSPSANNEIAECPSGDCVTTVTSKLSVQGGQFSYTFGKNSLTVFALSANSSEQTPPAAPQGLSVVH